METCLMAMESKSCRTRADTKEILLRASNKVRAHFSGKMEIDMMGNSKKG